MSANNGWGGLGFGRLYALEEVVVTALEQAAEGSEFACADVVGAVFDVGIEVA